MNKLPKYKITIDDEYSEGEDLGISMIAFTARPAILTKGFAFSDITTHKDLFFADELKYRITGPIMKPMDIYRCDEDEEYYVQFTAEEIDKIHQKFMLNFSNKDVFNDEHDSTKVVPAYLLDIWKEDDGTVMVTTQFTDKEVYKQFVEAGKTGYSIEGFLGMKLSEIIDNYKQKFNTMNENKLPAGEYPTADGKILVVAEDGTFTIKEVEKSEEVKMAEEAAAKKAEEEAKMAEEEAKKKAEEEAAKMAEEGAPASTPVEAYTKEEVDAKFEELYKIIAELKAEEMDDEEEVITEPQMMSVHQRFAEFVRFTKTAQ